MSATQQLYLVQQLCPSCKTIGIIVAREEKAEEVGDLVKSGMYYNFTVEQESPKKAADLPQAVANLLKKNVNLLWIFEDSLMADPAAVQYIVSQSFEKKIPVVCGSAKQLSFGATYYFGTKPDKTAVVFAKKTALNTLKLELPKTGAVPIEVVE